MNLKELGIDGARLRNALEELAKIGATPGGGVHRLALSDEDRAARDLFVSWFRDLGLDVRIDEMGNIFGLRPGRRNDLPPVMTGSHLDTQPKGGRFDGALGVMGALEVLRTLHDNGVETERLVVIVAWTNEEGTWFDASYVDRVAPTAMIFVPSIGVRSHVEVEDTGWEHCEAGANVLLHCVLDSADEVPTRT
jgi:N-carbamoyl-L-amino-acid hydrolase